MEGKHALLVLSVVLLLAISEANQHHHTLRVGTTTARGHKNEDLCRGIDHPRACIPIAKRAGNGGKLKLAKLSVQVTMSKAVAAQKLARMLQRGKKQGSMYYQLLDVCRANFESMLDDLSATMSSFEGARVDSPVRNSLSAVYDYLDACEEGYLEAPEVKCPFRKTVMRPMEELVDNMMYLADDLKIP